MLRRLATDLCTMLLLLALGASLPLSERAGQALLQLAARAAAGTDDHQGLTTPATSEALARTDALRLAEAVIGVGQR